MAKKRKGGDASKELKKVFFSFTLTDNLTDEDVEDYLQNGRNIELENELTKFNLDPNIPADFNRLKLYSQIVALSIVNPNNDMYPLLSAAMALIEAFGGKKEFMNNVAKWHMVNKDELDISSEDLF